MGVGWVLGAGLVLWLLREVAVVLRAGARVGTTVPSPGVRQAWAGRDDVGVAIPTIVWTYWHSDTRPPFVEACIANWRREAPECEVLVLSASNFQAHLPGQSLPVGYDSLPAYRQADWIRIQLLRRHGGIWLDATTLLTRSLTWVQEAQVKGGAEFVGFYIGKFTRDAALPVVENWFLAAGPGSMFLDDWAQEFELALSLGDERAYFKHLENRGELEQGLQGIPPAQARHLAMHVAASVVLARRSRAYRLELLKAEDGPFVFHSDVGWRKRHLYARLGWLRCPRRMPALVKLRGVDRRVFERFLALGWVSRRSSLARYLGPEALARLRRG